MSRQDERSRSRRQFIKSSAIGALTIATAGCSSDSGSGSEGSSGGNGGTTGQSSADNSDITMQLGGNFLKSMQTTDGFFPGGQGLVKKRVEEQTDGSFQIQLVGEGQICGNPDCPPKVQSGVLDSATTSIGNSTGTFPSNDVWELPYTFPTYDSVPHTLTKEETWENYWVAHGREYGVIPMYFYSPSLRSVLIGTDTKSNNRPNNRYSTPSTIEGLQIRRTKSKVSGKAISEWGASPVDVSWGDTLQGLKTGVTDGLETWLAAAAGFGMVPSVGEVVLNEWMLGQDTMLVSVDFLKSLSDENRRVLADVTKSVHEELVHINKELRTERIGYNSPAPEGTLLNEEDVTVTIPSDDEVQQWRDPIWPGENRDLYSDIYSTVNDDLGIDGEAFWEYLRDTAREDSIESLEDYTAESWWDEWIDEM